MTTPPDEREYTTVELADLAEVSDRQLQWWDERRVVCPMISGHRRLYTHRKAMQVMVVAALRRKGLSLQRIRKVLPIATRAMAAAAGMEQSYMVVTGRTAHITSATDQLVKLALDAAGTFLTISLSDLQKILDAHNQLPRRNPAPGKRYERHNQFRRSA